ncbi:hypothetical protein HHK36_031219 [Tetracentron sinense]|uniref:Uncharacterized protein n=1 Tax=Tetracentron sinense TaxID=13715 RepID=A0A834YB51_TETSI|nr:hypothetical protein HHK36_031219 [Tetracentron sinense]
MNGEKTFDGIMGGEMVREERTATTTNMMKEVSREAKGVANGGPTHVQVPIGKKSLMGPLRDKPDPGLENLPFLYPHNQTTHMITLHFPESISQAERMYRPQRESFVIQVKGEGQVPQARVAPKLNLSAMKLFDRFRKILMHIVFSLPSRTSSASSTVSRQRPSDRPDPPKTSCSSYYSCNSHYTEAIADCIEFFNKSSQEGILNGRKSDAIV